jgi:hypothetical protein
MARALETALVAHGLRVGPFSIRQDRASGLRRYTVLASSHDLRVDLERLARSIGDQAVVQELTITPLENEGS